MEKYISVVGQTFLSDWLKEHLLQNETSPCPSPKRRGDEIPSPLRGRLGWGLAIKIRLLNKMQDYFLESALESRICVIVAKSRIGVIVGRHSLL